MDFNEFWKKTEGVLAKACDYMGEEIERKEKEMRRTLAGKTDDELMRISKYANLSEIQRGLVEEELQKRGLRR